MVAPTARVTFACRFPRRCSVTVARTIADDLRWKYWERLANALSSRWRYSDVLVCHPIDTQCSIERVYICARVMGTPTPDLGSAHDHELVTDDELLVEDASLPAASDVAELLGPRAQEGAPRRELVRVGEVLAGKYRVERVHAPGALGVTCDAEHLQLRQRVVVKLCEASSRSQADGAARFLESARLAAQLRNSHLARVLDVGRLDTGIAYSVTEHLSGTDLQGVLRVREWLPVSEAVDYAIQLCEGLAVAHIAGFVHRNLKPTNVFLARESDGRPIIKVLDFCLLDGVLTNTSIIPSPPESVVGSLAYLAPEQVRDPSSVDVRADIWAVGALLHELLTGSPLYAASSVPGMFAAIAADDARPITQLRGELPRELEEVVLRCLEKERDYRWSDVGTLVRQLRRFASEEGRAAVDRVIMVLEGRSLRPPHFRAPCAREGRSAGTRCTGRQHSVASKPSLARTRARRTRDYGLFSRSRGLHRNSQSAGDHRCAGSGAANGCKPFASAAGSAASAASRFRAGRRVRAGRQRPAAGAAAGGRAASGQSMESARREPARRAARSCGDRRLTADDRGGAGGHVHPSAVRQR